MKAALALLAGLALAAPSQPQWLQPTGPGTRIYDGIPPARFQKHGLAFVVFAPLAELPELCGVAVPEGKQLMGCSRVSTSGVRFMFLPDPCPYAEVSYYSRIACHELAHAIGEWPGDHPL